MFPPSKPALPSPHSSGKTKKRAHRRNHSFPWQGDTSETDQAAAAVRRDSMSAFVSVVNEPLFHVQYEADPPVVHVIDEHVLPEEEELVWYDMTYLQQKRRDDIKNNLRAQLYSSKLNMQHIDIEQSQTMTWRGMEEILEGGETKKVKNARHVQAILQKQSALKAGNKRPDRIATQLSTLAHTLGKHDRERALELGRADQEFVHGKAISSTLDVLVSPSPSSRQQNHPHHHSPSPLLVRGRSILKSPGHRLRNFTRSLTRSLHGKITLPPEKKQ